MRARVQKCRRSGPHVPRRRCVAPCSTLTAASGSPAASPVSRVDAELDVKSSDARRGRAAYEVLSRCARQRPKTATGTGPAAARRMTTIDVVWSRAAPELHVRQLACRSLAPRRRRARPQADDVSRPSCGVGRRAAARSHEARSLHAPMGASGLRVFGSRPAIPGFVLLVRVRYTLNPC